MSYDFALERQCTHQVLFETVDIDPFVNDTIRFPRPISSTSRLNLYVDGFEVPQSGLYSYASITLTQPEPYRIKSGINDLIYLRLGNETPTIIQLPSGVMKASDLTNELKRKIPDLNFEVNNKRITISSRLRMKGVSFSFVDPRWTDKSSSLITTSRIISCYEELGINPGRVVSGIKIFPGWTIIQDTNSFVDGDKMIVFDSPIYNKNPFFQVTYFTNAPNCRRCFGSKIEFDYGIINGKYETIENADLLLQEFDKFLFTRKGSHWKWVWLGSSLIDRIGGKALSVSGTTQTLISMDVSQAFKLYQNIKIQQDNLVFQKVTDAEFPLSLGDLSVEFDQNDPTIAIVALSVVTRSSKPIELKRIVANPSSYSLTPGGAPYLLRG